MKKNLITILLLAVFWALDMPAQVFDYRTEESPAVSWNPTGFFDGRLLSLGGISLMASEPFAAALNPALIPAENKWRLGVSFNRLVFESFQYWGVNEGVAISGSPFQARTLNIGGLTLSRGFPDFRLSAGWYLSNSFEFPGFSFRDDYDYEQYIIFSGSFSGREDTFFAAAAFHPFEKIDIGVKIDYITAGREVQLVDFSSEWYLVDAVYQRKDTRFEQLEDHRSSLLRSTIGLAYRVSPEWIIGAALVYPFQGTTERTISRTFENITDHVVINNTQDARDTLYQPVEISMGTRFAFPVRIFSGIEQYLTLGVESRYRLWSDTRYLFFDEEISRDLRNTLELAFGLEYGLINSGGGLFFRMGYKLDPQPPVDASATLNVFCGGLGLKAGNLSTDIGIAYYHGTTGGIDQNHFLIAGSIGFQL